MAAGRLQLVNFFFLNSLKTAARQSGRFSEMTWASCAHSTCHSTVPAGGVSANVLDGTVAI